MMGEEDQMEFFGADLATGRFEEMLTFYRGVLDARLDEVEHDGFRHAVGRLGGIRFMLAPNEPANVDDRAEGVHQFHLRLSEFDEVEAKAVQAGATFRRYNDTQACVWDPDGNPWMLHREQEERSD